MNVAERNKLIADCVGEYQKLHDEYFPRGEPLSDDKWAALIQKMEKVAEKYTKIPTISGKLCMAYLDDVEEYHKKWTKYKENQS